MEYKKLDTISATSEKEAREIAERGFPKHYKITKVVQIKEYAIFYETE